MTKKLLAAMLFGILLLLLTSCAPKETSIESEISCSEFTGIFCGKDKITYKNSCLAPDGLQSIAYLGSCQSHIFANTSANSCASDSIMPVCSREGVTFANECLLGLSGMTFDYVGVCERSLEKLPGSSCDNTFSPVCTARRITFQNNCLALEKKFIVQSDGACSGLVKEATCLEVKVVCGVNNVTFGSACAAQKLGIAVAYEGTCK